MTRRSSTKRTRAAVSRRPLVVCVGGDADTRALGIALEQAGAETLLLDPLERGAGLTVECAGGTARGAAVRVEWRGRALHDARAVVLRRLPAAPLDAEDDGVAAARLPSLQDRRAAARERAALLSSALLALDDGTRLFLPPLATAALHLHKPLALARLVRAGVAVPESLATDDARRARAFLATWRERGAEALYKPVAGGAVARRFVDDDDARLPQLAHAPTLFQRRVPAADGLEHRLYVLDGALLDAFALHGAGATDARVHIDEARRVAPPRAAVAAARRAARALGMIFAGVDVRLEPSSRGPTRAVVLDVNPTPSLLDWPDGGRLVERLAAFVVERARGA